MAVDQDVDIRADRVPDQLHLPPRLAQLVLPGHAGHGLEGDQLERTPAGCSTSQARFSDFLRRVPRGPLA